jgi:hypothetical protein
MHDRPHLHEVRPRSGDAHDLAHGSARLSASRARTMQQAPPPRNQWPQIDPESGNVPRRLRSLEPTGSGFKDHARICRSITFWSI